MTKANTARNLAETRRINSGIVKASKATGGFRESDYSSESPYGAGSGVHKKEDMPVSDFEYKGFLFVKDKKEGHFWSIQPQEGLALPKELGGSWTDVPSMEKAVDAFLSRKKLT